MSPLLAEVLAAFPAVLEVDPRLEVAMVVAVMADKPGLVATVGRDLGWR